MCDLVADGDELRLIAQLPLGSNSFCNIQIENIAQRVSIKVHGFHICVMKNVGNENMFFFFVNFSFDFYAADQPI